MRPKEQFRSVLLSVLSNKTRVLLTSLGIIIGTFTIIMVVGIGKASSDAVTEQYKRLSAETITITQAMGGSMMRMGSGGPIMSKTLTKDQVLAMADELEHVKSVGISPSTQSPIAYGVDSETISIQGINLDYAEITNLNIQYGDFFTDADGDTRNKVVVLGYNVASYFFGDDVEDAIDEKVFIKGLSFTVVGVLQRIGGTGGVSSGSMSGSNSPDDMAYIPYEVAVKYTAGNDVMRSGNVVAVRAGSAGGGVSFVALASDINGVSAAIDEINEYIYEIIGNYTTYTVADAGSTLTSALETSNTMSALLIAIAAIVLIVSGIGIMNVLLVAVKERTREIGILKSIGAPRRVILLEFLLEAVFISVIGGLMGVLLSYYAPNVLAFLDINYSPSVQGLMLGFGFSVVTGVFFGYYPAHKASKLKPIDALNVE